MHQLRALQRFISGPGGPFRSFSFISKMAASADGYSRPSTESDAKRRADQILSRAAFKQNIEDALRRHIVNDAAVQRSTGSVPSGTISKPVIPIDDIRDAIPSTYAQGEKETRCKLAALYRLVDHYGWTETIYNHITARVPGDHEHFLLNPFGLMYHEVTASSLIKVDIKGNLIDGGSTYFGVNFAGFVLHSAVHSARPDAKCVLHVHHPACMAVSSMKCGFLPVTQEAVTLGDVSYHDFYGTLIDEKEREIIAKNFGPTNRQMILRNHGLLTVGESVEEAFARAYAMILSCEAQVRMVSVGLDNLTVISQEAKQRSMELMKLFAAGNLDANKRKESGQSGDTKAASVRWSPEYLEFEAHMRMLDSAGYRTGYPYRLPSIKRPQTP